MINLQWGGLTNGQIPTSRLVDISGRGDYLEPTAAAQYVLMRAAIKRDTGFDLQPAPGSSAYRPEAVQIEFFTERYTKVNYNTGLWWNGSYWTKNAGAAVAAIPDTSNHGWARACDFNISQLDKAAWAWMTAHAAEYGWSWATGKASGEDWHWECLTPPGTITTSSTSATPLEVIMALKDSIQFFTNPTRGVFLAGPAAWLPIDNRDGIDGQHKIDMLNKYVGPIPTTVVAPVADWDVLNQTFKDWALASATGK
jgi:hypothetical protein